MLSTHQDRGLHPIDTPNSQHQVIWSTVNQRLVDAPAGRELVRRQRGGAGGEGHGDHHAALAVPRLVHLQHLGVRRHIL